MPQFIEKAPCTPPEDRNQIIWRYMNLKKFEYLMMNESLYMCSALKLAQCFDKLEGVLYPETIDFILEDNKKINKEIENKKNTSVIDVSAQIIQLYANKNANRIFANCWNIDENESLAMWNKYVSDKKGVVIQSSYSRLRKSIIDNYRICISKIKYQEPPKKNNWNVYTHFLHKREKHSEDKELRLLIKLKDDVIPPLHIDLLVNLNKLIENVYVKPSSSEEEIERVSKILNEKGLKNALPSKITN